MSRNSITAIVLLGTAFSLANRSRASVIAYDGFDYPAGSLANADGGVGWSGGWYQTDASGTPSGPATLQVSDPSLIVPQGTFSPLGGKVSKSGAGVGVRLLANPFSLAVDADYYISLLLRLDATPTSKDVSLELFSGSTGNVLNEVFRVGTDSTEYQFKMIGATGMAGPTSAGVGGDAHIGTTYLVVAKIAAHATTNDQAFLATYPGLESGATPTEPTTWTGLVPGNPSWAGNQTIDRIRIVGGAQFTVDEVRIGTTWADVIAPPPVECAGDINQDGSRDLADLAGLLAAFGSMTGDAAYVARADLDDNGVIDLGDLAGFLAVFGADCAP
ncbi:MAG: hypothetical protein KDA32_01515 [Phycisphaerales bacterium]|nr:hypothetical protein [Phycisphaerales bacterium]